MSPKTTYKALMKFRNHEPGDEFTANLDEGLERRAIERGQLKKVEPKKKEEKADG